MSSDREESLVALPPPEVEKVVVKNDEVEDNAKTRERWIDRPYLQILVYGLACLTTSCLYFGWQPYQEMLFRGGAYSWLCDADWDYDLFGPCNDQDKAVTMLYSFAQGSEFACAFVAGLLLDHFGPRKTAVIGEALFALAILLISLSGQGFQMYIPAMMVSGGCVNIVAFPSLVVTETWPNRQALAVSIIVGAQSGASVIAPIIRAIWDANPGYTYFGIWGVYLLAIWLPISVFYVWALPPRRNYTKLAKKPSANEGSATGESIKSADAALAEIDTVKPPETSREKWKAFARDLKTIDLIVCSVYMFLLMLQFAYYPSVVRDAVGDDMSEFVGWMTPLQAPFSIIIGFAMDYTGTCLVMFSMCASLVYTSLTVGFGAANTPLMRATAVMFVFMQSATYNLKYTFVNEMYDPYNFGKLVGFLGIMGGVGVYVNAPIARLSNYKTIFISYTAIAAVMALLTAFLYWRQKKGICHKTIEGVEQKNRKKKSEKSLDSQEAV